MTEPTILRTYESTDMMVHALRDRALLREAGVAHDFRFLTDSSGREFAALVKVEPVSETLPLLFPPLPDAAPAAPQDERRPAA